jgi:hypothetical protein
LEALDYFGVICSLFACFACGQVFSHGRINDTLVGTTYVSLSEIARMSAMRVDPDEGNILTLPLHRPSGRIQGSISLWINLSGNESQNALHLSAYLVIQALEEVDRVGLVTRTTHCLTPYLTTILTMCL